MHEERNILDHDFVPLIYHLLLLTNWNEVSKILPNKIKISDIFDVNITKILKIRLPAIFPPKVGRLKKNNTSVLTKSSITLLMCIKLKHYITGTFRT